MFYSLTSGPRTASHTTRPPPHPERGSPQPLPQPSVALGLAAPRWLRAIGSVSLGIYVTDRPGPLWAQGTRLAHQRQRVKK